MENYSEKLSYEVERVGKLTRKEIDENAMRMRVSISEQHCVVCACLSKSCYSAKLSPIKMERVCTERVELRSSEWCITGTLASMLQTFVRLSGLLANKPGRSVWS